MFFATVIFITAFMMELIGSYISVVGLSSLSTDIVILLLAIVLDVAKIVSVTLLYKFWDKLNVLTKTYLIPAVFVTVIITSAGAYGYLQETFQKAILPNQEVQLQITQYEQRRTQIDERLKAIDVRKSQIDDQISKIPDTSVRGRKQLIAAFDPEKKQLIEERTVLAKELVEVDAKIPELKTSNAKIDNHVGGPVVAVAETFNIAKESAIKIVSAVIVAIFDPLAIVLILCGNQALRLSNDEKRKAPIEKIKKELEEAKWLHEAEKQKLAYQSELDALNGTPVAVESPPIVVKPEVESPQQLEYIEDVTQPEVVVEQDDPKPEVTTPPVQKRKKRVKTSVVDEPHPIVIDEKDLMEVLSGIVQGMDGEELSVIAKPPTLSEYGVVDATSTPDEKKTEVISGNIMDATHVSDHFADHSKSAHDDHLNFYKSNLPPQQS